MNILDTAMQKEKEAEAFYRDLAAKCADQGLKGIMAKLADAEIKHYLFLEKMKKSEGDAAMDAGTFLADVKALADKLAKQKTAFKFDVAQVDLYKLARQREREAQELYLGQAKKSTGTTKALFERLANQELVHFQLLDTIVEMVSHAEPGKWLENAEWRHADEY